MIFANSSPYDLDGFNIIRMIAEFLKSKGITALIGGTTPAFGWSLCVNGYAVTLGKRTTDIHIRLINDDMYVVDVMVIDLHRPDSLQEIYDTVKG
jgi:hypothetical protein